MDDWPKSLSDGTEGQIPFAVDKGGHSCMRKYFRCYWLMPAVLGFIVVVFLVVVFARRNWSLMPINRLGSVQGASFVSDRNTLRSKGVFDVTGALTVCDSPVCRTLGEAYEKSLDRAADPCEDFYAFTCGGMQRNYEAGNFGRDPRTLGSLFRLSAAMKEIGNDYLEDLYRKSLDGRYAGELSASDRQMVGLYRSCLQRSSESQTVESIRALRALFVDVGLRWFDASEPQRKRRTRNLLHSIGRLSLWWGLSTPWLDFRLAPSRTDTKKKVVVVTGLHHTKGSLEYNKNLLDLSYTPTEVWHQNVTCAVSLMKSCLLTNSRKPASSTLTLSLEYKLAGSKADALFRAINVSLTPDEFAEVVLHQVVSDYCLSVWRLHATALQSNVNHVKRLTGIRWGRLINQNLDGIDPLVVFRNIRLKNPVDVAVALKLLSDPETSTIIEHGIIIELLGMLVPLINSRTAALGCIAGRPDICNVDEKTFCRQKVREYLPLSGAALIGRHIITDMGLAELRAISSLVKMVFGEIIARLSWMDEVTKKKALEKLDEMIVYIGYPLSYRNKSHQETTAPIKGNFLGNLLNIKASKMRLILKNFNNPNIRDEEVWRKTLQDTNAAYVFGWNGILMPSNSLGFSYYVEGAPTWINVASSALGHEIMHGFDTNGSRYDGEGNKRYWWSNASKAAFKKSLDCFKNQYSVPVPSHKELRFNGSLSLPENLADNAGLHVLYDAFRVLDRMSGGHLQSLPGLEWLTPKQVFFIAWSYKRCEVLTRSLATLAYHRQVHAYAPLRVNMPLKNFDEFGQAFNCRPGSSMRPTGGKCLVF